MPRELPDASAAETFTACGVLDRVAQHLRRRTLRGPVGHPGQKSFFSEDEMIHGRVASWGIASTRRPSNTTTAGSTAGDYPLRIIVQPRTAPNHLLCSLLAVPSNDFCRALTVHSFPTSKNFR